MRYFDLFFRSLAVIIIFYSYTTVAHASPEIRKAMILATIPEAILGSIDAINTHNGLNTESFDWSGTYSDRNWQIPGSGMIGKDKISLNSKGHAWGEDGENLFITYTSDGYAGRDPVLINGKTDWPLDQAIKNYPKMIFRQIAKIGEIAKWRWLLGAELVVSTAVGVTVAASGTGATGGIALGPAIATGIAAGSATAGGLVTVSKVIRSEPESIGSIQPPSPRAPDFPTPLSPSKIILPENGKINVSLLPNGKIWASGPDGITTLIGEFDQATGRISGKIVILRRN